MYALMSFLKSALTCGSDYSAPVFEGVAALAKSGVLPTLPKSFHAFDFDIGLFYVLQGF